jgi:hypothetical protein
MVRRIPIVPKTIMSASCVAGHSPINETFYCISTTIRKNVVFIVHTALRLSHQNLPSSDITNSTRKRRSRWLRVGSVIRSLTMLKTWKNIIDKRISMRKDSGVHTVRLLSPGKRILISTCACTQNQTTSVINAIEHLWITLV